MEIHKFDIDLDKRDREVHIEPFGDLHVGNRGCDYEKLTEVRNRIRAQKWRYTMIMGDITDAIFPFPSELRFEMDSLDPRFLVSPQDDESPEEWAIGIIDRQYNWVKRFLAPIREKILLLHSGNHDAKLRKYHHRDWARALAHSLGVKYAAGVCMTRLNLRYNGERVCWVDMNSAHGAFGGRTAGGSLTRMKELSSAYVADIYFRGHTHRLIDNKDRKFRLIEDIGGALKLVNLSTAFVSVGSFLDSHKLGYTSYAEEKDYLPLRVGTATVTIKPTMPPKVYVHE